MGKPPDLLFKSRQLGSQGAELAQSPWAVVSLLSSPSHHHEATGVPSTASGGLLLFTVSCHSDEQALKGEP